MKSWRMIGFAAVLIPCLAYAEETKWSVVISEDTMTDAKVILFELSADEGKNATGKSPALVLRWNGGTTDVYIHWYTPVAYEQLHPVMYRIDSDTAITEKWAVSSTREATFLRHDEESFIGQLAEANKFATRTTPYVQSTITAVFDVRGLKPLLKEHAELAAWILPGVVTTPFPPSGATVAEPRITLDWEDVRRAAKYHIQANTATDFTGVMIADSPDVTTSEYVLEHVTADAETVYWRVRILNTDEGWGEWSPIWSFFVQLVPLSLVLVEAGSLEMGSNEGREREKPVHRVTLSRSFYMSANEVTHAQYVAFLNSVRATPQGRHNELPLIEMHRSNCALKYIDGWFVFAGSEIAETAHTPVNWVTWLGAVEYCNWLSMQEGLAPAYSGTGQEYWPFSENRVTCNFDADGYRLPTEAEWEYAARGGKNGRDTIYAGSNEPGDVAWYADNSDQKMHPVGQKVANELGLYDMSGNVREWCWDGYHQSYYQSSPPTDPTGDPRQRERSTRGGAYSTAVGYLPVAIRGKANRTAGDYGRGFRVVRTVTESE